MKGGEFAGQARLAKGFEDRVDLHRSLLRPKVIIPVDFSKDPQDLRFDAALDADFRRFKSDNPKYSLIIKIQILAE